MASKNFMCSSYMNTSSSLKLDRLTIPGLKSPSIELSSCSCDTSMFHGDETGEKIG